MAQYEKTIGQFECFPVSDVKTIKNHHWFWSLLTGRRRHSTVYLYDKTKFVLSKNETEELKQARERWQQILQLSAVVKSHQAAMQNR